MKKIILISMTLCIFTSCATLFSGTTDSIHFNSTPSKAKVLVNGMEKCKTPCAVTMKRSKNSSVQFKLDGYETRYVELEKSLNPMAYLNLISPLHWIIDAATGAMHKYDPTSYSVELEKE